MIEEWLQTFGDILQSEPRIAQRRGLNLRDPCNPRLIS
jgi:hypothetical protein